jgi:hypothetical protein
MFRPVLPFCLVALALDLHARATSGQMVMPIVARAEVLVSVLLRISVIIVLIMHYNYVTGRLLLRWCAGQLVNPHFTGQDSLTCQSWQISYRSPLMDMQQELILLSTSPEEMYPRTCFHGWLWQHIILHPELFCPVLLLPIVAFCT